MTIAAIRDVSCALAALAAAVLPLSAAVGEDRAAFSGVVTLMHPSGGYFFLHSEDGKNWRVSMEGKPNQNYERGDTVSVDGELEPARNRHATRLFSTEVVRTGHDESKLPPWQPMSIAELLEAPPGEPRTPDWYARPVSVEGKVDEFWRTDDTLRMVLVEAGKRIHAEIAFLISEKLPEHFEPGATVRVRGVALCSARWGQHHRYVGFTNVNVMADSIERLDVLSHPPFWTVRHLGFLVGAISLLAAYLLWSVRRRERLKAEAATIERLNLAHDLHDDFQQLLAGAMFRLETAIAVLPDNAAKSREQLEKARTALMHTQSGLRAALWSMKEEANGPASLSGVFSHAASRMPHWQNIVSFVFDGDERPLVRKFTGSLLMILQEAVGNAIGHGKARCVDVHVRFGRRSLEMTISDNGCGFDMGGPRFCASDSSHIGIAGMEARAKQLGGMFRIFSKPGEGTRVFVRIPYPGKKGMRRAWL